MGGWVESGDRVGLGDGTRVGAAVVGACVVSGDRVGYERSRDIHRQTDRQTESKLRNKWRKK